MDWIAWAALPLPTLSLITLVFALTRRGGDPRLRRIMVAVSGASLVLGVLLMSLIILR